MKNSISLGLILILTPACASQSPVSPSPVETDSRVSQAIQSIESRTDIIPWSNESVGTWFKGLNVTVVMEGTKNFQNGQVLTIRNLTDVTFSGNPELALQSWILHEARHVEYGGHRCKPENDYKTDTWSPYQVQAWWRRINGEKGIAQEILSNLCN